MALITDPRRDPFGAAMWDYLRGNTAAAVQVFSDIAIDDEIPVRYLFRTRSQMPDWEQAALDACQGRVLDIGAGAGGHALALQQAGHKTVAIDISPGAVEIMRLRGVQDAHHQDLWELPADRFDTILLMMNGIGVVGDLKGLNQFLTLAPKWLAPGGQILLDSSDLHYLYDDNGITGANRENGYYGIISYQMSYGKTTSEPFRWLYIDFPRLQTHARLHGFRAERLFAGPHHEYLARLTRD